MVSPGIQPPEAMFAGPIKLCLLPTDIPAHFFRLKPLVAKDFVTFRHQFLEELGLSDFFGRGGTLVIEGNHGSGK